MVLESWGCYSEHSRDRAALITSTPNSNLIQVTNMVGNIHIDSPNSPCLSEGAAVAASSSAVAESASWFGNMVTSTSPATSHMSSEDSPINIKQEPLDVFCSSASNSPNARKKSKVSPSSSTTSTAAGRSIEEELCLICGDRASGYHYNALSCEGCKGFFRRSITKGASYVCKNGGNCEMDMWMRRRCQFCRLKRCREVGMKEECLLSDDQCKARDARRKQRQKKPQPVREEQPSPDSNLSQPEERPTQPVLAVAVQATEDMPLSAQEVLSQLDQVSRELIEMLVIYQDKFELPSEDDIKMLLKVKVTALGRLEIADAIFEQMAGMTVLVTHLVVEFAKHLPGFLDVTKDDQIALLKGSACDIMMIRTARRYDKHTNTIVFADGEPYTKENLRFGGLHDYVDAMFVFCKGMADMGTDNAEYALLTAVCLMQDRPGLIAQKQVEEIQNRYVNTLQNYVRVRRGCQSNHFAKLLMKLTELRTLSAHYEKVLMNMKVERGPLPPLLEEFFEGTP